jgi:hypothetical protein
VIAAQYCSGLRQAEVCPIPSEASLHLKMRIEVDIGVGSTGTSKRTIGRPQFD